MSEYLDKDGLVLYNEKVEKALNKKQDTLIPGDGITIGADGKTISVIGGGTGGNIIFCDNSKIDELFKKKLKIPDFIDLGLPSGRLWAKWNIGGEKETDFGLYFKWGKTEGIEAIEGVTIDDTYLLNSEYADAATKMYNEMRIPTQNDFEELFSNTIINYADEIDGVPCVTLRSNTNTSKYITLPKCGCIDEYNLPPLAQIEGAYWISDFVSAEDDELYGYYYSCYRHPMFGSFISEVSTKEKKCYLPIRPVK